MLLAGMARTSSGPGWLHAAFVTGVFARPIVERSKPATVAAMKCCVAIFPGASSASIANGAIPGRAYG